MDKAISVIVNNFEYFLQKAEEGNIDAQFEVGLLYGHYGINNQHYFSVVPCDYIKAAKWLKMAADGGHSGAQYILGNMYNSGTALAQDYLEALKYYMLAAEHGCGEAKCAIGIMYAHGHGVLRNCGEAIKWLESSVFCSAPHEEIGNAAFNLGVMHTLLDDPVVLTNYTEAYKCFKIAAEHGYNPVIVTDAIIQCMKLMEAPAARNSTLDTLFQSNTPIIHQYSQYTTPNFSHRLHEQETHDLTSVHARFTPSVI